MINDPVDFSKLLLQKYPFSPTSGQEELLKSLSVFLFSKEDRPLFVLKGYAGTGKTSSMSTFVKQLWHTGKKSVLLAPTGRAAKVLGMYTGKTAFTIHKKIYSPKKEKSGGVKFVRQANKHDNTVFIVDEASMISDQTLVYGQNSLLEDLIDFVFSGKKNSLIFIGDTAQLPPVKYDLSPALATDQLSFQYNVDLGHIELDEVVRQGKNSSILENATTIRSYISDYYGQDFKFNIHQSDLVYLDDGYDIEQALVSCYDSDEGVEETAFIVRSNKRANQYNQQIRTKIRGCESEITVGDYIMVVKNNYFWLPAGSESGFIANGDICEISAFYGIKELYGFRFAEVQVRMVDYPNQMPFETVLLLNTLESETPNLSYEDNGKLYKAVQEDYAHLSSKYKQLLEIKKNKFFNALQVKFAYAVTCHKSQGGQWKNVFIEKPYLPDGQSVAYLRWLYTAITRAQEKIYLIGFKPTDLLND